MDQPKHKNVYDKNNKFILVLYSVHTIWQSLHDYMLIYRNLYFQLINLLFLSYTLLSLGWSMKTK